MAKKSRTTPTGGDKWRPTDKELNGFVTGETNLAQRRNLGRNDENSWPDIHNEVERLTRQAIEEAEPGKWKAMAKMLIRSRDFVDLMPQLAPGMAPDSKWVRRVIRESYGEVDQRGLTDPDEKRREAMTLFIQRGGHVRNWLVHHEGVASLQQQGLFRGPDYDDVEDPQFGAEAVADDRSEAESEAVDSQIDFVSLEWDRLTPRQRIVGETIAFLGLRPFEIAKALGVSKATISSDMKAIRDWLLWHQTTPPTDPPDTPAAAAEDVA